MLSTRCHYSNSVSLNGSFPSQVSESFLMIALTSACVLGIDSDVNSGETTAITWLKLIPNDKTGGNCSRCSQPFLTQKRTNPKDCQSRNHFCKVPQCLVLYDKNCFLQWNIAQQNGVRRRTRADSLTSDFGVEGGADDALGVVGDGRHLPRAPRPVSATQNTHFRSTMATMSDPPF